MGGCGDTSELSSPEVCTANCGVDEQTPTSANVDAGGDTSELSSPEVCTANCGVDEQIPTSANVDEGDRCVSLEPSLFQTAQWPMPGSTGEGPRARYRVDGDITHDEMTGLDWQRQLSPERLLDEDAREYCAQLSLGGHCDFRLPTRIEGVSLLDLGKGAPAFDENAFAALDGSLVLWSGNPERQFRLGHDGSLHVRPAAIAGADWVRCVRGGTWPDAKAPHYELTSDLAIDTHTNLTWTRSTSEHDFVEAAATCSALQLDGGGFRVPSLKELHTLVLDTRTESPWVDAETFSNFPAAKSGHIHFWTSSRDANNPDSVWMLDFATGTAEMTGATATFTLESSLYVLCVRSGS